MTTPDSPLNLAQQALDAGKLDDALDRFIDLVNEDPSNATARIGAARALQRLGRPNAALHVLSSFFKSPEAINAAPPLAWIETAAVHRNAERHHESRLVLESAPDSARQHPAWALSLSGILLEQGHAAAARDVLASVPGALARSPLAASAWLRAQLFLPEVDAGYMHAASRQWTRWHGGYDPIPGEVVNRDPGRRLRVVFVNSRLRNHNSAHQLLALLPHMDRKAFHITLVSTGRRSDAVTEKLRPLANAWVDLSPDLPANDAVKILRGLKPDILIDQNEHSNNGPIALFTRRIAPIQLHWHGNALSTGLSTLDGRISDSTTEPPGETDRLSSEPILRMPHGYLCYSPPHEVVEPADPAPDYPLTLGGIHHLAKCNDEVLQTWARILQEVPHARLLLARHIFADAPTRDAFAARCHAAGIPPDRLVLRPDGGAISRLSIFNELDLILDTWPFGGEATSMDALWMGVPILTRYGDRITGRRTTTLLRAVGRDDLVTHSIEDYVKRAVELCADVTALRASRAPLRAAVRASDWCNAPLIAADFGNLFRTLWTQACKRFPAKRTN